MKIAIPTNGGGLNDTVAPLFARAPAFYIANVDEKGNVTGEKIIQNSATMAGGGAGPRVVQTLINEGVDAVVVPQVGPNALGALQAAGVQVYQAAPGTPVEEAIKAATSGSLGKFTAPAPAAPTPSPAYGSYPTYGYGPGSRGRGGRGRGWGRGGGRGWGAQPGYCPRTGQPKGRARWHGWW